MRHSRMVEERNLPFRGSCSTPWILILIPNGRSDNTNLLRTESFPSVMGFTRTP